MQTTYASDEIVPQAYTNIPFTKRFRNSPDVVKYFSSINLRVEVSILQTSG